MGFAALNPSYQNYQNEGLRSENRNAGRRTSRYAQRKREPQSPA